MSLLDNLLNNILYRPFISRRLFALRLTIKIEDFIANVENYDEFILRYLTDSYVMRNYKESHILGIEKVINRPAPVLEKVITTCNVNCDVEFIAFCFNIPIGMAIINNQVKKPQTTGMSRVNASCDELPFLVFTVPMPPALSFIERAPYTPLMVNAAVYITGRKTVATSAYVYKHAPTYFHILPEDTKLSPTELADYEFKIKYAEELREHITNSLSRRAVELLPKIFRTPIQEGTKNKIDDFTLKDNTFVTINYGSILSGIKVENAPENAKYQSTHNGQRGKYLIIAHYITVLHILAQFATMDDVDNPDLWRLYSIEKSSQVKNVTTP